MNIEPGAAVLMGDPELLSVALGAIVDNALRFSPPDKPVHIRAQRVINDVEADEGSGMSEVYLERAFQSFTQEDESTTREKQGLGIGLFAARKAVELMGGQIQLEATAEGGTEVTITVPQRRSQDATAQPRTPEKIR